MNLITKNNLLKFIPKVIPTENEISPERIFEFNEKKIKKGNVAYIMECEIFAFFNFVIKFAQKLTKDFNSKFFVIYPFINYSFRLKKDFIAEQIIKVRKNFEKNNLS